jgi:putative lipoic acid-binding regulatory protein
MSSDPFDKLRAQLELQEWPNVYLFKFIVPNNSHAIAQATALFDDLSELNFHESKTGKYVSVTAKEMMLTVDDIIAVYNKAAAIEGIISL